MQRDLSVERLYFLGDFKNIKLMDVIKNIPQEVALDDKFMAKLNLLQLVEIELRYRRYEKILETQKLPLEDAIKILERNREILFSDLKELITNGEKEK